MANDYLLSLPASEINKKLEMLSTIEQDDLVTKDWVREYIDEFIRQALEAEY